MDTEAGEGNEFVALLHDVIEVPTSGRSKSQ